ncbi:MAG: hypothetical protein ACJAT2_002828 [Bacteriovoracaceae bacterium]|jgi:hypothetical protein
MKKPNKAQDHALRLLATLGESKLSRYKTFFKLLGVIILCVLGIFLYLRMTAMSPKEKALFCQKHSEAFLNAFYGGEEDHENMRWEYNDCLENRGTTFMKDSVSHCIKTFEARYLKVDKLTIESKRDLYDKALPLCAPLLRSSYPKFEYKLDLAIKNLEENILAVKKHGNIEKLKELEAKKLDFTNRLISLRNLIEISKKVKE